jgi:hypothetical protein
MSSALPPSFHWPAFPRIKRVPTGTSDLIGNSTGCSKGEMLPLVLQVSYAVYYKPCVRRDRWHVVVSLDVLSSFHDLVNLHWNPFIDDLKPDGRERSEKTVRLTERVYRVWSGIRLCPNLNSNPIHLPGKKS